MKNLNHLTLPEIKDFNALSDKRCLKYFVNRYRRLVFGVASGVVGSSVARTNRLLKGPLNTVMPYGNPNLGRSITSEIQGQNMTYFQSLSAAGFAATAISFGPARMGFGLFVPEFKSVFSMSQSMVGLVSSFGFAGFFVGLLIAQFFVNRWGPEFPVLIGLIAATIGMGIVALAPNVPVLTTGVFVAASSAGFAWTPFNDAVHRKVREVDRPTALSKISTGTSVGIAAAGGLRWRWF